uniref:thioredoxin family protein n=1 Tax=Piscinibacter terrae TaxID=2496871 RepID=UPI0038B35FFC
MLAIGVVASPFAASPDLPPLSRSLPSTSAMPSLDAATGWINSAPLAQADLRGKVVLVDFWTYSCINCLRTLPYVRAWAQKYRAAGLVVVGVHTPEFEFEQQAANVQRAVSDLRIDYPVALDSRHAVWQAFGNRAWPALYFVDAQGRIRHRQYGEGGYEDAERLIQQLLKEAGRGQAVPTGLVAPQGDSTQAAPSAVTAESGETYVGFDRASGFTSSDGALRHAREHTYAGAPSLRTNEWTLAGTWKVEDEFALLRQPGGRITYRFRARDLHLVLGSDNGQPVRFRVSIDGRPPGQDHGADTDAQGRGTVQSQRLYQLVRQASPHAERTFEIEFLDPGVRAYAFTFG